MSFDEFIQNRLKKQGILAVIFVLTVIGGWHFPVLGFFIVMCMFAGIGIGFLKGRKWCDWYCPRGSFYDILGKYLGRGKEIPRILKKIPLRVTILSILMVMMSYQLYIRWPDARAMGMFFVMLLTGTTVLGIIFTIFLHRRTWCYVCPVGTVANLAGGRGETPLTIESESCTECQTCEKVCPVQISPAEFKENGCREVKEGDCLKCGQCENICPVDALNLE